MVKCYVINLEKDSDRRVFITEQLDKLGMAYTIFNGVYGKTLTSEEMSLHYDHKKAVAAWRELTLGEIGCALSHVGVCRDMVENNVSHALILEDDARLHPDVPGVLEKLQACYDPADPVIVLLTRVRRYRRRNSFSLEKDHKIVEIFENHRIYGNVFGAHGYFLTQEAAQQMIANLYPVWLINDFWPKFQSMKFVQMRALVPYCIGHSHFSAESTIEDDREELETKEFIESRPLKHFFYTYVYQKLLFQIFIRPFLKNQKKTW